MLIYSKSRSWKSAGAFLDDEACVELFLSALVFKRVLIFPVLLLTLWKDVLEPLAVVLLQFSVFSVELEDDTSNSGGSEPRPSLLDSWFPSRELDVAWGNAFDWLGLVFDVVDDGKPNENWVLEEPDDGLGWL